jgi:sRNA-binding regulator protein Hfq
VLVAGWQRAFSAAAEGILREGAGVSNKDNKGRYNRAPDVTHQEVRYLKYLIDRETPVRVRLRSNEEVTGTIEYYDHSFIRLTREDGPNLFIFKHDIKYLCEEASEP